MAAKVATDLKRMQRFYGAPSDLDITGYENEVIQLLKYGYLGTVKYGFKKNGNMIEPTIEYTAHDLYGVAAHNDDPGKIRPRANTSGASFYSYLTYSSAWWKLTDSEREGIEKQIYINRGSADEPGVNGYYSHDRTYSSGGKSLDRATVRSY
jgi:hypothetical protein